MDPMELDPEKNPSPYGAESEPPLDEAQAMLDESEEIAANLTTDWEPSGLPVEVFGHKELGQPGRVAWFGDDHSTSELSATIDTKQLSDADQADLARENATIRENVVAAGSGPHHFKPAEWTHPNGHPRCILCGAEERTDGMCTGDMVPTGEGARSPSRPKEAKGDTAGHEFHGNRYTGGIGSGFKEPGDPAPGSFRLYHGTTVAAVEMAKTGSGYVRNDPARVAGEVERHFKLPSGSVANHPHFFPNGVQRAINAQRSGKPLSPVHDAVYLTPNREFARYYSQLGSETVHDAIRAATEVRAASGTLTPEERVAMYDDYKKDQVGVVLHVDVPASAFPSKLDMMSGESIPVTPAEFMQRLRSGGELRLKSIPHEYVRAIEVPDPNKPIDLNKPAAYYGDKASWSVDSKGDVSGHGFHGNRYTGGIGGGERVTPRLSKTTLPLKGVIPFRRAVAVSAAHFDHIANVEAERSTKPIMKDWIEQRVPTPDATPASHVKSSVSQTLAIDTGLSYERANDMVRTWAMSASDTTPDSVALQMAAAEKFGTDPGEYLRQQSDYMKGGYRAALETGPPPIPPQVASPFDSAERNTEAMNEESRQALDLVKLHDAVTMSMRLDKETSFVVPAAYLDDSYVGRTGRMLRPFPGFGDSVYTENDGWRQTPLENGDVRFTRDNVVEGRLPEGRVGAGNVPISWDQRMADATKVVDATYERTQKILAEEGVKDMTLFRGMNWTAIGGDGKDIPESLRSIENEVEAREGADARYETKAGANEVRISLNPLSSFSVNSNTALQFASGSRGVTLGTRVPADRIFCTAATGPGCLHEGEVIVIGGPTDMIGGRGYPGSLDPEGDPSNLPQSEYYG